MPAKRSAKPKRKPPKKRKVLTEKQKRLLKLLSENIGIERPLTLTQIFIKAGYTESVAHQQSGVLAGIQDKIDPIVAKILEKRDQTLDHITKGKLRKAGALSLAYVFDILTKNHQLLTGKPTDRTVTGFEDWTEEKLNEFIKSRKDSVGEGAHRKGA